MRSLIAAQLSVWHLRLANWHFARGEALMWRYYALSNPHRPKMTPAAFMVRALAVGLAIAAVWLCAWRAS